MIRRLAAVVALSAGSLVVAACGSDDGTPQALDASGDVGEAAFNDADVAFARDMIPHHRQAVEMAALAPDRSENPTVLDLAARIEAAQDPEIAQMAGWLETWGHAEGPDEMESMAHEMAGMMGGADMDALEAARGVEFDHLFAEMMIEHHEGAIEMAETLLDDGSDPVVRQLAESIIAAQGAEITEMRSLDLG